MEVNQHVPKLRVAYLKEVCCFINYVPCVVASPVHLLANDAKLYRRVTTLEDHNLALQDDLTLA